MKLAKKVLACVVALALIGTLAISAFAADAALTLTPASSEVEVGKTVTLSAALTNAKGLENGTVTLVYDPAVLEVVNIEPASVKGLSSACDEAEAGVINDAFAYTKAAEEDTTALFTVEFKVKAAGSTTVTLSVMDGDISGIDEPAAVSATIKGAEVTVPETTTAAPTVAPSKDDNNTTKPEDKIPATGDAGIAVAAGLVVLAGAAFVASKKTK